jgi:hypothetical protein
LVTFFTYCGFGRFILFPWLTALLGLNYKLLEPIEFTNAVQINSGLTADAKYTVQGGGARYAADKVFQHDGMGTAYINNFYVSCHCLSSICIIKMFI